MMFNLQCIYRSDRNFCITELFLLNILLLYLRNVSNSMNHLLAKFSHVWFYDVRKIISKTLKQIALRCRKSIFIVVN